MGDCKHYCPVALKEKFVLFPGNKDCSAKYREKYYYFSNQDARETFVKDPEKYTCNKEPLKIPPLRLIVIGARGSGKTMNSRWLADKLGIFHIQFKDHLQELIFSKTKRKIGPEYEEEPTEEEMAEIETIKALEKGELPEKSTEEPEVEKEEIFTIEEEAIKLFLTEDEPLPSEVLDSIIPKWWNEEPFKSKGFVLDGFFHTADDVQYLAERGLFPDATIQIKVHDNDVIHRLFPPQLVKWKEKRNIKLTRKKKIKELKKKLRVSIKDFLFIDLIIQ
uniref:Uncharacterized protein n=1 Tax=Callorhinchus milii TaxID=7868 RepID=A0A4W3JUK3_CALMI